jgi:hypothetical protein
MVIICFFLLDKDHTSYVVSLFLTDTTRRYCGARNDAISHVLPVEVLGDRFFGFMNAWMALCIVIPVRHVSRVVLESLIDSYSKAIDWSYRPHESH